jgi:hypothetical protein
MEFVSLNSKPLLVISIMPLCMFIWLLNMVINHRQQAPSSLTFASLLAKLNSAMDQELLQCFHISKVHMHSIKNSPRIRIKWSDFQTYPYYLQPWSFLAFTWVLSNWKTERSSQVLCLKFFVQPLFWSFYKFSKQNSEIPLYDTLKSLNICGICGSSPGQ